jgi:alpha-ribazole phosphatase
MFGMKLYLIRHTKPDVREDICYGKTDLPVSLTYPEELKMVSKELGGFAGEIGFDFVFSSPLIRARQLAEDIFGDAVRIDERLSEMHFGHWEMWPWLDIGEEKLSEWFKNPLNWRPPHGESFGVVIDRFRSFLNSLSNLEGITDHSRIAVFTHGGIIKSALVAVNGIAPRKALVEPVAFGEIREFEFTA